MNTRVSALLALTLAPIFLTQCDDGGANIKLKGLRDEIEQLNHQNYETQQQVTRLQSQIEASRTEKKKLEEEKQKVEAEREAAAKQLDQLKRDFETYKSRYKLSMRQNAPGMKVGDFVSSEGKSYKNVVLREINDSQVNFTHEGGIMKLHYKQLPETMQDMLGFLIENKPEQPKEVKILTPRQQNAQTRNNREKAITDMETNLSEKRRVKEALSRKVSAASAAHKEATLNGGTGIKEADQVQKLELQIKQVEGEILKAELDLHSARSQPLKLVPER